jgi:hypothetical protein
MSATATRRHRPASRLKPGQTFGYWQVIRFVETDKPGDYYFCRCVCGKEKAVEGGSLRKGTSSSCGCRMKNSARPHAGDAKSTGPETQAMLALIAQGYLPPADQFSAIDGSPCWSLVSIAMMLGLKLDELQHHLLNAGRRFTTDGKGV